MVLLGASVFFPADAQAVVYLEIIEVPASTPSAPKKNPFAFGKKTQDQPEPVITLSERFALTAEGKRKAKKWATSKSPNETHRIVVYKCPEVLRAAGIHNTEVIIDIGRQSAFLLVGGAIGLESEISTARSGKVTPKGSFKMTERVRNGKISNLYDVEMPYWMRLDDTPYGVHAGYLPGYPASAGCIRLPHVAAEIIYRYTARGSTVRILNVWRPSTNLPKLPDKNSRPPKAGRFDSDLMTPTIPKYPGS
ncbi:MAG: L,D-transpeptidase [Verrucomicrobiota bacterium]